MSKTTVTMPLKQDHRVKEAELVQVLPDGKSGELRFDALSAGEVRLSTIIDAVSLGRPYKIDRS